MIWNGRVGVAAVYPYSVFFFSAFFLFLLCIAQEIKTFKAVLRAMLKYTVPGGRGKWVGR